MDDSALADGEQRIAPDPSVSSDGSPLLKPQIERIPRQDDDEQGSQWSDQQ